MSSSFHDADKDQQQEGHTKEWGDRARINTEKVDDQPPSPRQSNSPWEDFEDVEEQSKEIPQQGSKEIKGEQGTMPEPSY